MIFSHCNVNNYISLVYSTFTLIIVFFNDGINYVHVEPKHLEFGINNYIMEAINV